VIFGLISRFHMDLFNASGGRRCSLRTAMPAGKDGFW